jgi:hypothetical protein
MKQPTPRSLIAGRVIIAHGVGLFTTGIASTIGTSAGFNVLGGAWGLTLGLVLSTPWMAALAIIIWLYGGWIERHPILFAVIGPLVVCGSFAILAGPFLKDVAISSVTSSFCYLAIVACQRFR